MTSTGKIIDLVIILNLGPTEDITYARQNNGYKWLRKLSLKPLFSECFGINKLNLNNTVIHKT